jgi:hypothetical protein
VRGGVVGRAARLLGWAAPSGEVSKERHGDLHIRAVKQGCESTPSCGRDRPEEI